jgi:hypothetical protein
LQNGIHFNYWLIARRLIEHYIDRKQCAYGYSSQLNFNGGLRLEFLLPKRIVTWILAIGLLPSLAIAEADLAQLINQAALHGLDDTSLVVKNKKVILFGIQTNGADTKNGKYGCAKVVSVTLRKAGVDIPVTLGVSGIEMQLRTWNKIRDEDSLQPGDVVIWTSRFKGNKNGSCTGGGTCHVGIKSEKGMFHNNPLGYQPIYDGLGLATGYKFKLGLRPNKIKKKIK